MSQTRNLVRSETPDPARVKASDATSSADSEAPAPEPASSPAEANQTERRHLGPLLDDALARMERRARGDERPIPLPWETVSAAVGGGLWGGTLVTLLGDTGSGKTQWALQAAVHAAEAGVPVCYVASDAGVDQVAARLFALKAGEGWSDLYVGHTDQETLDRLRSQYTEAMKALSFEVVAGRFSPRSPPDISGITEATRNRYPEEKRGTRPVLVVLDFVQLASAGGHDRQELEKMMRRVAEDARRAARDLGAVVTLVSSTSRQVRQDADDTIGIHRDRRAPLALGHGNPGRLIRSCKDSHEVQCESDTVLVLARDSLKDGRRPKGWIRVWCAVAKSRVGSRAWCALKFDGNRFEEDLEATASSDAPPPVVEEHEAPVPGEE